MKKVVFIVILSLAFLNVSKAQGLKLQEFEKAGSEHYFNSVIGYMNGVTYTSTYKRNGISLKGYVGEGLDLEFKSLLSLHAPNGDVLTYLNAFVTDKGLVVLGYVTNTLGLRVYAQKVSFSGTLEGESVLVLEPENMEGSKAMKLGIKQSEDKNKLGVYYFGENVKKGVFSADISIFTSELKQLTNLNQTVKMDFVKEGSTDFTFDLFVNDQNGYVTITEENVYEPSKNHPHHVTLNVYNEDGTQVESLPTTVKDFEIYKPVIRNRKDTEGIWVTGFIKHKDSVSIANSGYVGVTNTMFSEGDFTQEGAELVHFFKENPRAAGISSQYKIDKLSYTKNQEIHIFCAIDQSEVSGGQEITVLSDVLFMNINKDNMPVIVNVKRGLTRIAVDRIKYQDSYISYPDEQVKAWDFVVVENLEEVFFLLKSSTEERPQERLDVNLIKATLLMVKLESGNLLDPNKIEMDEDPYVMYLRSYFYIHSEEIINR